MQKENRKVTKLKIRMNSFIYFSAAVFSLFLLFLTFFVAYDRVKQNESVIGSSVDSVADILDGPVTVSVSGKLWKPLLYDRTNAGKPLVLLFLDLECPFTRVMYEDVFVRLVEEHVMNGNLSFGVINFPQEFHPQSDDAAAAAECVFSEAGRDGYLGYVQNILSVDISRYSTDQYISLAKETSSDVMEKCLRSDSKAVEEDLRNARELGVNTTPAVFIGRITENAEIEGELLTGSQPYEEYTYLIEKYR